MKKIVYFCLCFVISCGINKYDKEFKNPVFNQPLRPLSRTLGYAYITPTSVDFSSTLNKNEITATGACDLIENKQERITLKCKIDWSDGSSQYGELYTYILKEEVYPNCQRVLECSYKEGKTIPNEDYCEKYCVTPLDKLSVIEEERQKYCDTPPDNIDDLFAYYKVCFRYQDKEPENFPKDILSNIKNKP